MACAGTDLWVVSINGAWLAGVRLDTADSSRLDAERNNAAGKHMGGRTAREEVHSPPATLARDDVL